ncbi:hypothetical protein C0Q70_08431 [Pomacea canaliculata]|uniref:Interleukin 17-like protein n=2 Tax=Pomacea canaliculata TaxID=400727 RepID=A0A2T7PHT4_POMCA|nr:hypothetical protein C0Q70_08431 [Pomacea canaliculata]
MILMSGAVAVADLLDADETFYLDSNLRKASRNGVLANRTVRGGERSSVFSGLSYCPSSVYGPRKQESIMDALPRTSSCPWQWTLNYDSDRQPSTLLTATCSCHDCQNTASGFTCSPVFYYRRVKYIGSKQKYGEKLFPISVGCTCNRYSVLGSGSAP